MNSGRGFASDNNAGIHPEERDAIAEAGYRRCVPAYSYDGRMKAILEWHRTGRMEPHMVREEAAG